MSTRTRAATRRWSATRSIADLGKAAKPCIVRLHWILRSAPLPAQLAQATREAFRRALEQEF
jgi:hypothetical protein